MNKVIVLLPIKKESKRVPKKNFRMLEGKPLYRWILDTLLTCSRVERICIDTDSDELISTLKRDYPFVKTILRPESIRGGAIPMNRIIDFDMSQNPEQEHFFQTHTTNPLLSAKTIDEAIEAYFSSLDEYDSMFSVNRIQARTYWGNGVPINHRLNELKQTQDLDPVYEENSNFFIFSRDSFQKSNSRLGIKPKLFETPRAESFEIDEEEDFELIEQLIRGRK